MKWSHTPARAPMHKDCSLFSPSPEIFASTGKTLTEAKQFKKYQRQYDATEKPQVGTQICPLTGSQPLASWRAAAEQDCQDTASPDTPQGCSKDLLV